VLRASCLLPWSTTKSGPFARAIVSVLCTQQVSAVVGARVCRPNHRPRWPRPAGATYRFGSATGYDHFCSQYTPGEEIDGGGPWVVNSAVMKYALTSL